MMNPFGGQQALSAEQMKEIEQTEGFLEKVGVGVFLASCAVIRAGK